jgi:3-phosphoshikimate 1-carboxyvinyltransferase
MPFSMSDLPIHPFPRPLDTRVRPVGSKSMTNRALVLAALAEEPCTITNALFADDTAVMLDSLGRLGFTVDASPDSRQIRVQGRGGKIPSQQADLDCGASGTTLRFLTALCTLGRGNYRLDGTPRMRRRPIDPLIRTLRNLGARLHCEIEDGYPPLLVHADGLPGGAARYGSAESSQFLSAICMVAPYARHEVRIDLDQPQTSWPYVKMTLRLMDHFAVTPELVRDSFDAPPRQIILPREHYRCTTCAIEPDATAASYFLAAAAISPGSRIVIEGLGSHSLQGDVQFANVLAKMGATVQIAPEQITLTGPEKLDGIEVDLADMPDTAQTLAVVACFAAGQTTITGLHTLRIKETDRLAALEKELTKLGARVTIDADSLRIEPPAEVSPAAIDTYDDHRMAMSFAVAGTRIAGIVIRDSGCVSKTYPQFFEDLASLQMDK